MKERVTLELPPDLRFLHRAATAGAEAARRAASAVDMQKQDAFVHAVELAVSEVFTNAVKHKRAASPAWRVLIHFGIDAGDLEVIVKDRNPRFGLGSVPLPDVDTLPESGYGLYLVKQVMDTVTVHREADGNVVTMTKTVKSEDAT
ncbi:MAG: ATP-binding protein [Desulfobacterales bacterium]|nr:ATP-binding protein [Desulfobacterales bacterium]